MNSRQTNTHALRRFTASSHGPLRRALLASALVAAPLLAAAQTTLNAPPLNLATKLVLPSNLPVLSQPSGQRPISASDAQAITQALNAANTLALTDVGKLNMPITAPVPAGCSRRILAFGTVGANTSFTVRPGQQVVLQGCFANTPTGEMRLNGMGASGYLTMQMIDWKPNYVTARVPANIGGQYDRPVRLQLRFADGDFSNELIGQFVASRAKYEISGTALANYVDIQFVSPPKNPADYFSWRHSQAWTEGLDPPPAAISPATPSMMIQTPAGPQLGSYYLKPKHPQHKLLGYYISLFAGQSQFSNWGPNGELTLDWASSKTGYSAALHYLRFDKLVVEAPLGTLPGAVVP